VYVALPSFRMNLLAPLVGRPDRATQEVGRVGLMGRRNIEWRCTRVIYTARSEVSVSLSI